MADCKIQYTVAPNGEVSKLFGQLLRVTGDQERAFKVYLDAIDTSFSNEKLNDQGEPTLSALHETNFFEGYENVRYEKGPSGFNQREVQDDVADHVTSQLEGAVNFLEKQINSGLSEQELNTIKSQIRRLKEDIGDIHGRDVDTKVHAVRQAAERQLDWVDTLDEDSHPRMLLLGYRMVRHMWDTDNTYQFLSESQRTSSGDNIDPYKQAFSEIGKEADKKVDRIVDITLDSMEDYIEQKIGRPVDREELTRLEDIGTLKENFFNISHVDQKITQFIREITINASRKEDSTIQDLQETLNEFEEDIDPKVILREDENGNKLPELISPYSKKYYQKRSEIKTEYYNKREEAFKKDPDESRRMRKRLKKGLYKKLNEIEILINPNRLSENTADLTEEEKEYKQELIDKGIDSERVEFAIENAKSKLADYRKREREHEQYIQSQIADGLTQEQLNEVGENATPQQWGDVQMAKWRRRNSPFRYYEDRIENDSIQYLFNEGFEHTYSLPEADADNYSDAWKELSEREKDFWHYYTDTINKVSSWLPAQDTKTLDETFLPKVKKSFLEQFRFNGAFYAGKNMLRDFMDNIRNMDAKDELFPEIQEEADEIDTTAFGSPADRDKVPVRFIEHPYFDRKETLQRKLEEGEITENQYQEQINKDLSLDPIKALQMFTAMGLNYKNMTDVSAMSELAYAMIEEANTVDSNGDLVSREGPVKLQNKVESEINHLVYGISRKQNEGESSYLSNLTTNPLNSLKTRRRKKELRNERDKLEEQFQDGDISVEKYNERLSELQEEYDELGGKPLVWSKLIDNSLLPYGQMKGMGFNFFAGIRNIGHALAGGLIHAAGGQEFNDSNFINGLGIFMKDLANRRGKVSALMSNFSILFETADIKVGDDRKFDGIDPYIIQNRTEFVGQGVTMIASMLHETVTDIQGNERSLWEAYDKNGNWKRDEFGDPGEWEPGNQLEDVDEGSKFVQFRNKVIQLNNSIHGDYAQDSDQRLKRFALGRLISMFRTWIPELVAYRWQKTRYDQHLGREVTGTYRDTGRSLKDNGFGETLKVMLETLPGVGGTENSLTENQAANVRRTAREMELIAMISAAILGLSASVDEDDEPTMAKKLVMNNLIMLGQDLSLWMNPGAQIQLAKNPIPATGVYMDYEKAMYQTYEALSKEDYQGESPAWKWSGAMPVIKQMNTVKWASDRILQE